MSNENQPEDLSSAPLYEFRRVYRHSPEQIEKEEIKMGRPSLNLIGKVFGRLTVEELVGTGSWGHKLWKCKCECGGSKIVTSAHLNGKKGRVQSCGCLVKDAQVNTRLYLVGKTFNRLKVIEYVGVNKHHKTMWKCECECGKETIVPGVSLTRGYTNSCGCYKIDRILETHTTHGMSKLPEYGIWLAMDKRCRSRDPYISSCYSSRGIKVCDEWSVTNPDGFLNFYSHIGIRPFPEAQIDRIDNNENYEPGNVRWVTRSESMLNTRTSLKVDQMKPTILEMISVGHTYKEINRATGIGFHTISNIKKGIR